MTNLLPTSCIELAIDSLSTQGYSIVPDFFDPTTTAALAARAYALKEAQQLSPASTGKQTKLDPSIRGDRTYWLSASSDNQAEQAYLQRMQQLKEALNRDLYLGLDTLECHFALYPVGTFYKKHLDQFKTNHHQQGATRQVSCILYLNKQWQATDGGELRLYLDEQNQENFLDIAPIGGTLVLFLSSRFYHEVLPAKRERLSLTGWFKTRENSAF